MVSKLTLGTAQLGMNYGISNKNGKPTQQETMDILNFAENNGIASFDTSPSYGNSEKILGSFFKKNKNKLSINIITKIPQIQFSQKSPSFDDVYDKVKEKIITSCNNLQINQISTCLLHEPSDMHSFDGHVVKSLIKLKKENIIQNIGVSTYTPEEVKEFLDIKEFDSIEIPMNIFDLRLMESKLLARLNQNKKTVFARSIYWQGLFFLEQTNIPQYLENARRPLNELKKISIDYGISIPTIALSYVRDLKAITSMVIGVENVEQLKTNIKLMDSPRLPDEVIKLIYKKFQGLSEKLINPSKWQLG